MSLRDISPLSGESAPRGNGECGTCERRPATRQPEDDQMAARGKSNQEIADYLHISANTVKFHLSCIYQKVDVTNRRELKNYLNK